MNQKLTPLLDRILVLQDWGPEKHPGSEVLIPQPLREKQRPNTGVIAAVGPGRRYDDGQVYPLALQKGQRVMFAPAETLTKVQHDGQDHLMMREQDVFLVLDKPEHPQELGKGAPSSATVGASLGAIIENYKKKGLNEATFMFLKQEGINELAAMGCKAEATHRPSEWLVTW